MTWPPPELEDGEEPELKPPEVPELELEPVELDPVELEPELVEPELEEPVEVEPEEVEPELAELEPELVEVDALALCVEPGRTSATAPAATTLATVTAVVVERTLPRPRSLAAMARRIPSRSVLLMYPILGPRTRKSLREPSR